MEHYLMVLTDRFNYWGQRSGYRLSAKAIIASNYQAIVVLEKGIVNPNLLGLLPHPLIESQFEFDSILDRILLLIGEEQFSLNKKDLKVFDGIKLYIYKQNRNWNEQSAIDDSNEIACAILKNAQEANHVK